MLKSSKSLLVMSVLALTMLAVTLSGCEKQAKTGAQELKPAPKTSVAGKAADANAVKTCPMKGKKSSDVKKKAKCVSDANAAAKPCHKMMCAIGDDKAANKNICCEHKGKKYCFCCEGCKKQFEKDPEKYAGKCK
jgi:YHS domain-containing protein